MAGDDDQRLRDLDARITAAQAARAPDRPAGGGKFAGAELAWRMVIDLLSGVGVGGGMGYGLDSLFGTIPIFLILFMLLGLAAGVLVMMRTAAEHQRRLTAAGAADPREAKQADPARE